MNSTVDVVVVGGGPAGATTGLLLARLGICTLILESGKGVPPNSIETMHPVANRLLADLGVWAAFCKQGHTQSEGIVSFWGADEERVVDFFRSSQGAGWNVDRAALDDLLLSESRNAGASVIMGTKIVSCKPTVNGSWELNFLYRGTSHRVSARYLVDATGKNRSAFAECLPHFSVCDRLIGIIHKFKCSAPNPYTIIEATEEGWFFSTNRGENELSVVYFTDADIFVKRTRLFPLCLQYELRLASHTRERIEKIQLIGRPAIVSAATTRRHAVMGEGWISVGDAAQSFDPLSSLGIFKAVDSASKASVTVLNALNGKTDQSYQEWSDLVFNRYWQNRIGVYNSERRWCSSAFWQRRHERPPSTQPQKP